MYNSNEVAERIKNYAKLKKITMKNLLSDAGLSYNVMTTYRTSMPKADNLAKIADQLNCSVDYLLGRTDVPEINKGNIINITDATPHKLVAFGGMQNEEVEPPIDEKTT